MWERVRGGERAREWVNFGLFVCVGMWNKGVGSLKISEMNALHSWVLETYCACKEWFDLKEEAPKTFYVDA